MNTNKQKLITCITCSAPLPLGHDGAVQEPAYFGGVSIGWSPENLGHRDAEDIEMILKHMSTVTDAIRDKFNLISIENEKKDPDFGRGYYLKEARSLCSLLEDLRGEVNRRINGLDTWLQKEIKAEERGEV